MSGLTRSRRWALLLNYLVGYTFLYPLLAGMLSVTVYELSGMDIRSWLSGLIYLFVLISSLMLAWPLIQRDRRKFLARPRAIVQDSAKRYVVMYFSMLVLNVLIILLSGQTSSQNQETIVSELIRSPLQIVLVTCVFAPIVEELVFRGVLFTSLRQRAGYRIAALVSGLLFGLLHVYSSLFAGNWMDLCFLVVYGAMGAQLCLAYEHNETLFSPILMHAFNNLISVILILV